MLRKPTFSESCGFSRVLFPSLEEFNINIDLKHGVRSKSLEVVEEWLLKVLIYRLIIQKEEMINEHLCLNGSNFPYIPYT